ncbi:MAG: hypothetical protein QOJ00_1200 [Actinomycetota bacterium]
MALDPEPVIAETADSARYASADPAISVLISTFRRPHYLAGLIDCLEAQDCDRATFEVVLVDNASNDTTWDELRARAATTPLAFRAARIGVNGGPATGRNAALSLARPPLVAFTDDDTLPEPGWVTAMLRALEAGDHLVQGRTEPAPGALNLWNHTVAVRANSPFFETCNIGYRRDELIAVGGFRPLAGYRAGRGGTPFGGEDTVAGWHVLRAARAEPTFASDAVVLHRVEPRDYQGWLHVRKGMAIFPALVASVPEMRRHLFWRCFHSPRTAMFDLAVVGLVAALAFRSVFPLLAVVPYVWIIAPRRGAGRRNRPARIVRVVWGDINAAWSLLRGSIRYRRVVL